MTRDEILALPVGDLLDALVAQAKGWQHVSINTSDAIPVDAWARGIDTRHIYVYTNSYHPSRDIADAMPLIAELQEHGDVFLEWWNDDEWFVTNHPIGHRETAWNVGKPTLSWAVSCAYLIWKLDPYA